MARSDSSAMAARTRPSSPARGGCPASAADASANRSTALVRGVGRQRRQGQGGRLPQGTGGGQPFLLGLEPRVLVAAVEGGGVDLLDLVAEEVGLACPLQGVAPQGRPFVGQGPEPGGRLPEGGEVDPAVVVQGPALGGRLDQRPVLVLAVELEPAGRLLPHHLDGGHPAVHPRLGAASGDDRPGEDDLPGGGVGFGRFGVGGPDVGRVAVDGPGVDGPGVDGADRLPGEACLDQRPVGAGPHQSGVGPSS